MMRTDTSGAPECFAALARASATIAFAVSRVTSGIRSTSPSIETRADRCQRSTRSLTNVASGGSRCGVPPSSSNRIWRICFRSFRIASSISFKVAQTSSGSVRILCCRPWSSRIALVTDWVSPSWMWIAQSVRSCNSSVSTVWATVGCTPRRVRNVVLEVATLILSMEVSGGPVRWV